MEILFHLDIIQTEQNKYSVMVNPLDAGLIQLGKYEAQARVGQTGLTGLLGMVELIGKKYISELRKNFRLYSQKRRMSQQT